MKKNLIQISFKDIIQYSDVPIMIINLSIPEIVTSNKIRVPKSEEILYIYPGIDYFYISKSLDSTKQRIDKYSIQISTDSILYSLYNAEYINSNHKDLLAKALLISNMIDFIQENYYEYDGFAFKDKLDGSKYTQSNTDNKLTEYCGLLFYNMTGGKVYARGSDSSN